MSEKEQVRRRARGSDNPIDPAQLLELARSRASRPPSDELAPAEPSALSVPEELRTLGSYELSRMLGRGGTGKVYKARHQETGELVAIKVLSPQYLSDEQRLLRFQVEAKAATSLEHPNIVHIQEVGNERGYHYMVMDYVEGIELSELVEEEPLPPDMAARITMTIAHVIHYVHRRGILHRDLKPSNVMIDTAGHLWVTDFGVAKLQTSPTSVTSTGMLLGTPSYMPPEQVGGKSDTLGPTCDVYSLGAVLYELLTGLPPFQGDSPYDTLRKVLHSLPVGPREFDAAIPRSLEAICLKCLDKNPAKRYASAAELADDLASFLQGRAVQAGRLREALLPAVSRQRFAPELSDRWGRILRWHAFLWLVLCGTSQLLLWSGVEVLSSLKLLWGAGGATILLLTWGLRASRMGALTALERQVLGVLGVIALGGVVFAVLHSHLPTKMMLGTRWEHLVPFGVWLAGIAAGCLMVLVDASFWFLCLALLGLPFLYLTEPQFFWLPLGLVLGVGLFFPGQRLSQR